MRRVPTSWGNDSRDTALGAGLLPRSLSTAPNANAAIASPQTAPTATRLRLILAAFTASDVRRRLADSSVRTAT